MRRAASFVCVFIALFCLVHISLAAPVGKANVWSPVGNMSTVRNGSSAAILTSGAMLVTGGRDENGAVLSSAELLSNDGSFKPAPPMNIPRAEHTATFIQSASGSSGFVLVVGGTDSNGVTLSSAELYDENTNTWTLLNSNALFPRAGHTATLLPNRLVLLVGGENSTGPLASVEVFSLDAREFSFAGNMSSGRKAHATAALKDGRALIVGGIDAEGRTLASTVIYDPTVSSVMSGPPLSGPRAYPTATTLLNGQILIAGGAYAEGTPANSNIAELNSTELFDPLTMAITPASPLQQARSGHLAFLLPNNNNVLIVGGTFAGSDLATTEIYRPWTNETSVTAPMSFARSRATGAPLVPMAEGQLAIAGGSNQASAEVYGFPTLKTDADDYAPGTAVMMSGSGWVPGETVNLYLHEVQTNEDLPVISTVADENGNFIDGAWAPDTGDIGIRFYLTAVGTLSQAQITFTDASTLDGVAVGTQSPNPVLPGGSASYPISFTSHGNGSDTASLSLAWSPSTPSGVSSSFSPNPVAFHNTSSTLTISTTGYTPPGTYNFTVQATQGTPKTASGTLVVVAPTTTTVTSSQSSSTYGDAVTFTATVTPSGATGTVTFKDGSTTLGTGTLSGGVARFTTNTPLSVAGPHSITAAYAGNASYSASTSSALAQSITKKTLTVTGIVANGKIYDGTVAATLSGAPGTISGVVGTDAVSLTGTAVGNFATKNVGTGITVTVSGQSLSGASAGNYTLTEPTLSANISSRPITVTAASSSKAYDGTTISAAIPTITSGSLASGDSATWTQSFADKKVGTAKTLIPAGSISDGNGGNNYDVTFANNTSGSITGRTLALTAIGVDKVYDGTLAASVTLSDDRLSGDTLTATYSSASFADKNVGPAKTINVTGINLAGSDAANYTTSSSITATAAITPATLNVTASGVNKTYDGTIAATALLSDTRISGDVLDVTYSAAKFADKNVGNSKPVTVTGLSLSGADSTNYILAATSTLGTANITPALLTFTADDKSIVYGSGTLPLLTATPTGFVGGDAASVLSGEPAVATTATTTSAVGMYPITVTAGGLAATNYTFTFVNGNLSVTKAPLTVAADNKSMTYGGIAPELTYKVTGFANGDTSASLTTQPTLSTTTNAAGNFPISVSGAASPNYTFTYVTGVMTVNKAPLTVTADNKTVIYGDPLPTFTYAAHGFVSGDGLAAISGLAAATTATSTSSANSYAITISGGVATNYDITYVPGTLTITKAPLIITPGNITRAAGAANPALTGAINGVRNNDPIVATYTTTATQSSPAGSYPITVASVSDGGTGVLANYDVTTTSGTLTVTTSGADLAISAVTVAGTPAAGRQLQVTETITNQGGSTSGASATYYYLSTDGITKGAVLGTRNVSSLLAGGSSTSASTVTLPTNLVGSYYVIVCADAANWVTESSEANNCLTSSSFSVAGSDLVESSVNVVTANPLAGGSIQVSDTVLNQGTGTAIASATYFYLSSDGVAKGSALGTRSVASLSANGSSTGTTTLTLPTNLAGTYYVIACADGANWGIEANEANNCRTSGAFTVGSADLIATAVNILTASPISGGSLQVSDTTANQGSGKAGASATYYYLSTDGITKGAVLGTRSVSSLLAGGSSTATSTVTLPTNLAGIYYVIVCADATNWVTEFSEANNCLTSSSFSVAGSDLVESSVNVVTANPLAGGSIQVSDTVLNQGTGTAIASATYFYLSSDGVAKGSALGTRSVASLSANGSSTGTTTLTLPTNLAGTYYVIACADGANWGIEANEGNNCRTSTSFTLK